MRGEAYKSKEYNQSRSYLMGFEERLNKIKLDEFEKGLKELEKYDQPWNLRQLRQPNGK